MFAVCAKMNWNVHEVENMAFKEREACVAKISFEGEVEGKAEGALAEIKALEHVMEACL